MFAYRKLCLWSLIMDVFSNYTIVILTYIIIFRTTMFRTKTNSRWLSEIIQSTPCTVTVHQLLSLLASADQILLFKNITKKRRYWVRSVQSALSPAWHNPNIVCRKYKFIVATCVNTARGQLAQQPCLVKVCSHDPGETEKMSQFWQSQVRNPW